MDARINTMYQLNEWKIDKVYQKICYKFVIIGLDLIKPLKFYN